MNQPLAAAIATLVTMGILDAVWLATATSRLYRPRLGELLLPSPMWAPAIAFYLLYAVGVLVLIVLPALRHDWSVGATALAGAVLGLVAYGTYNLTNLATIRGWSPTVVAVDLAWGATLTAVTATVALLAARAVE